MAQVCRWRSFLCLFAQVHLDFRLQVSAWTRDRMRRLYEWGAFFLVGASVPCLTCKMWTQIWTQNLLRQGIHRRFDKAKALFNSFKPVNTWYFIELTPPSFACIHLHYTRTHTHTNYVLIYIHTGSFSSDSAAIGELCQTHYEQKPTHEVTDNKNIIPM